ncbi:hypothetical protein S7711_04472 [Stachybotrys chartarum IBT 7711]|uniref:Major facilitator superfamily (MFS) profile domain-containing protein n=1 Tax=Stachybotrys chartarum (strain CBS 109288 / IBT 7711) TaxID=1280523 RepID=A0A084BA55_STACB|nr:hypothetical protein S7711_04472 [Stachybotrys chartarum IBT 7711]
MSVGAAADEPQKISTGHDVEASETLQSIPQRYSVFTGAEKWCIVAMVSFSAWFSTLTSFIYYPALQLLAEAFSTSVDRINLSITCYMAVATVAPTLVGDAADVQGRRLVYVAALALYLASNLGLALTDSYGAHLALRIFQAFSISGMY